MNQSSADALPESLVVVSNRQPYSHEWTADPVEGAITTDDVAVTTATGGVTSALDPLMRSLGGTWVAWASGDADMAVADEGIVAVPPGEESYDLKRVPLSDEEIEGYYHGYANQVLWPLCHEESGRIWAKPTYWEQYRVVNERFAKAVRDVTDREDTVWFQDYHFALAPRRVRTARPDATLHHFWHIPWPAPTVFDHCPRGEAVLDGLLACDVIGFHTESDADHFRRCVEATLSDATVDLDDGVVRYEGTETRAVANPLGIDVAGIRSRAENADTGAVRRQLLGDTVPDPSIPVVVGVERLDYSKGIPERIAALDHLWERRPDLRGAFTYVQKASRTREGIADYRRYRQDVVAEMQRINERYGTDDWHPAVYTERRLSAETLAGLYRVADAALVTPHRDGMNLVAHEYPTACVDGDGALVLSELAGAATRLDGALTVNPHDIAEIADALERALELDERDRRDRLDRLQASIEALDSTNWVERQFRADSG
ncbi:alpha,alpha-trehalose-phosphate synthase (UDP-forming) [Haloarcula nitratireducens]|uniref:Trehalose-6-phosphate synthase n=1 Tax=Haloarcula nitratireducens TaxID=2487749 RepID=A0AAW4P7S3_9EURY|nr:trehalose-6-phosphate synthase [Halomicroarcula nitratireducens]MBX0293786.1 trehalose-6-phosphate synthase [Halomicroarcula nitratireducens]